MGISLRTRDEAAWQAVAALGLDPDAFELSSTEVLTAALRRTASFSCPTSPRLLVDTVLEALQPLVSEGLRRDDLNELVDRLVAGGDLLELPDRTGDRAGRLVFLGPPSFIEKAAGVYLVSGTRPFGATLVPPDIKLTAEGHMRIAVLEPSEGEARLRSVGLHKISKSHWAGLPARVPAEEFLRQYRQRLAVARPAGGVAGLSIIDPSRDVTYYRGRWRVPAAPDTGDFIGRRPQAYGADLWTFVRVADGAPERLLDLPVDFAVTPGRDDAWRIQAAIDASRDAPQLFRVRAVPGEQAELAYIIDFFSPLPTWADRYLELVGSAVDRAHGALFSYRLPADELSGLQSVLTETLWMSRFDEESQ